MLLKLLQRSLCIYHISISMYLSLSMRIEINKYKYIYIHSNLVIQVIISQLYLLRAIETDYFQDHGSDWILLDMCENLCEWHAKSCWESPG